MPLFFCPPHWVFIITIGIIIIIKMMIIIMLKLIITIIMIN